LRKLSNVSPDKGIDGINVRAYPMGREIATGVKRLATTFVIALSQTTAFSIEVKR